MTIKSPIFDLIFYFILWLILLENTISGYLILWKKRETYGCLLEGSFTLVRIVLGIEDEEKRRQRLLHSRLFKIEYAIAWVVGILMLIIFTGWILYLVRNL